MNALLYLLLIPVALVVISLVWRFASRRYTIPCPVWMKGLLDPPSAGGTSARTRKTIEHLAIGPGMRVLDAGCGPGRLAIPLAGAIGHDGEVTALDIQEEMLHEAEKRARAAGLRNIRFLRMGLGDGGLEQNHYDRALLITVLGEIPDREAALRDLFGALKPGGILLIDETIRDPHFQTRSTVRGLADAAGFVETGFFGSRFSFTMTFEKPPGV